jgi:hypothetical protein
MYAELTSIHRGEANRTRETAFASVYVKYSVDAVTVTHCGISRTVL